MFDRGLNKTGRRPVSLGFVRSVGLLDGLLGNKTGRRPVSSGFVRPVGGMGGLLWGARTGPRRGGALERLWRGHPTSFLRRAMGVLECTGWE
jgi:hypothetical protein